MRPTKFAIIVGGIWFWSVLCFVFTIGWTICKWILSGEFSFGGGANLNEWIVLHVIYFLFALWCVRLTKLEFGE